MTPETARHAAASAKESTPFAKKHTVTLFVPTLNEIVGMKQIMPLVKKEWCDQILVVDGNSTDGTAEYAREMGYDVVVQSRPGIRVAYVEGFRAVKGEMVITFSPDGNSVPEVIPDLIRKMEEGYDMVIASRYLGPAKSEDDDVVTGFGNFMFTKMINFVHRAPYTDAMVIYRAYWTRLFYELGLDQDEAYAPEKWFFTKIGIEPLLSVRAAKARIRIGEVPGDEPARVGGVRKLQVIRWGASFLAQVFREKWYWTPPPPAALRGDR
jgi:glycosyltransferase involved in cell wall biosynthesis